MLCSNNYTCLKFLLDREIWFTILCDKMKLMLVGVLFGYFSKNEISGFYNGNLAATGH